MNKHIYLITGGCGFIGSNFIHYLLRKYKDIIVVNLDKLTYAGNPKNLSAIEKDKRYRFIKGDIGDKKLTAKIFKQYKIGRVVNFAAETHVDRSITGPDIFVETNVSGVQSLLEIALNFWNNQQGVRFLQVSTDEVYGSIDKDFCPETFPLNPASPYSASKAGADLILLSWYKTFKAPVLITRSSNNYGPYQFPEKFIPLMIINCLNNKELPVYGDGLNVRDWLCVEDHCRGLDMVLEKGRIGEIYNISGNNEWRNIDTLKLIIKNLGKTESLIKFVKDRPAHDRRYGLDAGKIKKELNWQPRYKFEQGLKNTINWYIENKNWWQEIINKKKYREYYKKMYGK